MKKGLSFLLSLLIFVQALVVYIPVSAQDNNETYYDEYIVKYKDTETVNQDGEKTRFKARNNYTVKKELSSGLQVIHFENPEDAKGTLKSLESDNSVEYVVLIFNGGFIQSLTAISIKSGMHEKRPFQMSKLKHSIARNFLKMATTIYD